MKRYFVEIQPPYTHRYTIELHVYARDEDQLRDMFFEYLVLTAKEMPRE